MCGVCGAGPGVVGLLCCFCRSGLPAHRFQLWLVWNREVLAGPVARLPFLDVHIHNRAPHRAPHPLQGGARVERSKEPALRYRALQLSSVGGVPLP